MILIFGLVAAGGLFLLGTGILALAWLLVFGFSHVKRLMRMKVW
jgi:hypothetical protein